MGEEEKSTAKNLEGMSTKDSIRKKIDAFYNRRRQKNTTEEGEKEEGEEDKSAEGKPKDVDEKPEKEEDKSAEGKPEEVDEKPKEEKNRIINKALPAQEAAFGKNTDDDDNEEEKSTEEKEKSTEEKEKSRKEEKQMQDEKSTEDKAKDKDAQSRSDHTLKIAEFQKLLRYFDKNHDKHISWDEIVAVTGDSLPIMKKEFEAASGKDLRMNYNDFHSFMYAQKEKEVAKRDSKEGENVKVAKNANEDAMEYFEKNQEKKSKKDMKDGDKEEGEGKAVPAATIDNDKETKEERKAVPAATIDNGKETKEERKTVPAVTIDNDKSAEGKPKEVDEKPKEEKRDGEEEKSTAKNLEGMSTKDSLRKKIDAFYRRRQKNNTEEGEKEEGEEDKSAEGKPKEVDEKPEKEEEKSTAKNLEGMPT